MNSCAAKSAETRHFAPKMFKQWLTLLSLSIICLQSDKAMGADKYNITLKDGTIVVGFFEGKGVKFNASYATVDVNLRDIVSFSDGFLTLADGSKFKGRFSVGDLTLETVRGKMQLPFESITSVTKSSMTANASGVAVAPVGKTKSEDGSDKPKGLRIGMQYKNNQKSSSRPPFGDSEFSATVYLFQDQGVSVFKEVIAGANVCRRTKDGSLVVLSDSLNQYVAAPKGTLLFDGQVEVLLEPGDRMPVLENAPSKIEGTSVYVDWSQGHTKYFQLCGCNSGSEVFTIKNDGLVLESATSPGFNLTLAMPSSGGTPRGAGNASSTAAPQPAQTGATPSADLANTPPQPRFRTGRSLNTVRDGHSATLLTNGKVIIAGGGNGSPGYLRSAEMYDPATGTWTTSGSMNEPRKYHTATLLADGKVLVAGGDFKSSSELFDPDAGMWKQTGKMQEAQVNQHTATLLANGQVLVVGGFGAKTPELYDPGSGTWKFANSVKIPRIWGHTTTLLLNGKVLLAGGAGVGEVETSAELYDPPKDTWTLTRSMIEKRGSHTATLLTNGKVLVAGGERGFLSSAELFDPTTETWTATGAMNHGRYRHTATLLSNGNVLVAGGADGSGALSSAELYDPASGKWKLIGGLNTERNYHTATLLANGQVLFAGGLNRGVPLSVYISNAEIYESGIGK